MIFARCVVFTRARPPAGTCRRAARKKQRKRRPVPAASSCTGSVSSCKNRNAAAPPVTVQRCAECRRKWRWLRRGLCWRCYSDPLIRGRHFAPEKTRLARRPEIWDALDLLAGVDIPSVKARPCPGPVPGHAGSAERVQALALRADAKCELFPPRAGPLPAAGLAAVARLFGVTIG